MTRAAPEGISDGSGPTQTDGSGRLLSLFIELDECRGAVTNSERDGKNIFIHLQRKQWCTTRVPEPVHSSKLPGTALTLPRPHSLQCLPCGCTLWARET